MLTVEKLLILMEDGRLRQVGCLRLNNISFTRLSREHCKIVLLLSALLLVPLRDTITACLFPHLSLADVRGIGYGLWGVVFSLFFVAFFVYRLKVPKDAFVLGFVILSNIFLFGLQRPEEINGVYKSLFVRSMLLSFPYYIIARDLKNYELFELSLYRSSFVINLLMLIVVPYRLAHEPGYSMGAAYAVLPGAIIAFRMFLRRFSFLTMLNAGVSLCELFLCGTRGPVVCYGLFCLYEITFNRMQVKKYTFKKILIACFIGCIVTACINVGNEEVLSLYNLRQHGLSVRLFKKVNEGNFFEDTARGKIWRGAWAALEEFNYMGVGLLEDRMQIFLHSDLILEQRNRGYQGYYSHLVFLDWIMEFGIIIGVFVSLYALIYVRKIISLPQSAYKSCMEIVLFAGCVPLLFSMVWHESRMFYILLGMTVSVFGDSFKGTNGEIQRKL